MQRLAVLNNQFAHVPVAPPDAILNLTVGFNNDKNPNNPLAVQNFIKLTKAYNVSPPCSLTSPAVDFD